MKRLLYVVAAGCSFMGSGIHAPAAQPAAQPSIPQARLEALVLKFFPGAAPAKNGGPRLPSHRIADFDADGRADVVVLYTDDVTAKRGDGCYGLAILTDHAAGPDGARLGLQFYNCLSEYTVEVMESVPTKAAAFEVPVPLQSARPCVRIISRYDDRDFVCHTRGEFHTFYSTSRIQASRVEAPPR